MLSLPLKRNKNPAPSRVFVFRSESDDSDIGLLGIEPSLRAPKARVLPVYYSPAISNNTSPKEYFPDVPPNGYYLQNQLLQK